MAKDRKSRQRAAGAKGGAVSAGNAEADLPARPKVGPFRFLQQVRQEASMVTWPARNETMVTTIMVFIMVVFASLFFLVVDQVFSAAACRLVLNSAECSLFGFDI